MHPYKPWADESEKADQHFRCFKASTNVLEWTVYYVPVAWMHCLYSPAIPVVGKYLPWVGMILSLAYAHFNTVYAAGYTKSAADRVPGFKKRTMVFKAMFFSLIAGLICAALNAFEILPSFE